MISTRADTDSVRLGGLLSGVLVTQIVNSAVHLAQPLLVADLSGSLGTAAFFTAFGTAVHMLGTYLGGWPTDRFGARLVLVFSTLLRGVVLAGIPIAMAFGFATLPWVMCCYTLEALVRGYVDTAVHTVPLDMVGHRRDLLDRINSRYEVAFEVGAVAGPLMLGGLMLWAPGIVAHIVIPIGFAASAACYLLIPKRTDPSADAGAKPHGGSWEGLKYVLAHPYLLLVVLGLMVFHLYELRKILSAFFAKGLLHHPAAVGQVGAAFALGGVAGALLYSVTRHRKTGLGWVFGGVVGTVVLAVGWMPVNLPVMVAAVFLFGVGNVCARLVLTRWRQELTPLEHAGGVTAASEFGRTAVSVGVNSAVGGAFSSGVGVYGAFGIVGGMLGIFAVAQLALARLYARRGDPNL
ncbi:MFS transporter [Mycobacterium sp. CVI_P3]|uniref:MFS transporter n=1 Tax=Mycobacterium pinniadriaticum TaxID=2994102 RepID=A0ABT3SLA2_9MYCO|nr:MFS transporter [Mycobacterium pinniadriaticum]MCX2933876.1 MFS transporter [Mycobacterium pinniadriaticum]MCX2940271.1 MFS transporter [Mycobacterium pinniadriaticum]